MKLLTSSCTALLIIVLWSGCILAQGGGGEKTNKTTKSAPKSEIKPPPKTRQKNDGAEKVVVVSNVKELIAAIAPNRTIMLRPATYILSESEFTQTPYVSWTETQMANDETTAQRGLTINNVTNLKIIGLRGQPVRIVQPSESLAVLLLNNSSNVTIENLELGHSTQSGWCFAGVVTIYNSASIHIVDCNLYGSGLYGLTLYNVRELRFENSVIRDCSYQIAEIGYGSDRIIFSNSKFTNSGDPDLIRITQSTNISFLNVEITNNKTTSNGESMFYVSDSKNVILRGCKIRNNRVGWFEYYAGSINYSDRSNQIDFTQFKKGKSYAAAGH